MRESLQKSESVRQVPRTPTKSMKYFFLVIAFLLLPDTLLAQGATGMYWTTRTEIYYASFDTLEPVKIIGQDPGVPASYNPEAIVLDEPNGTMYWYDGWTEQMMRANLDGSGLESIIDFKAIDEHEGQPIYPYFALDSRSGKLYWSVPNKGIIQRANTDGTAIETVITAEKKIFSVQVNHAARTIYWVEYILSVNPVNTFKSADLGIWEPVDLFSSVEQDLVRDFVVHEAEGKMYWVDRSGFVYQANLDGTESTIASSASFATPEFVTVDEVDGTHYWSDSRNSAIWRRSADLSPTEMLVRAVAPKGIALSYMDSPLATRTDEEPGFTSRPNVIDVSSFPNPFSSMTKITIEINRPQVIRAGVYNLLGQEVVRLADTSLPAGKHVLRWDGSTGEGRDVPTGIYFVRVEADSGMSKALSVMKQ